MKSQTVADLQSGPNFGKVLPREVVIPRRSLTMVTLKYLIYEAAVNRITSVGWR